MTEAWIEALTFAALSGAAFVRFERREQIEDGTPTINYMLQSRTESGAVMGDDRDYDLLKAVMRPLESLSEAEDHTDLILELDLRNKHLARL